MSENLGAKFSIDITQLQAGLKTANKLIRENESEFKASAATMENWNKSEKGLSDRISSLSKIIEIQGEKVRALSEQYQNELAKGMDENSDRAIQLRTQINNETASLERNKQALAENENALKALKSPYEQLQATIDKQKSKLEALGKEYQNAALEKGKNSKEAKQLKSDYDALSSSLEKNEKDLADVSKELENTGKAADDSGEKISKLGDIAKTAGAVAATAIAAIGAGVLALTKSAVENYANYEQLVGGVETLFGAGGQSVEEYAKSVGKSVDDVQGEYDNLMSAQNTMIENANNAYKTAGMSANEYMENVTGFSASLISSLDGDTVKAAAAADRAMTDISDNANKMGTDINSIVDTYQSLARGNYQMLDNLKLGYGGTKSEMERLIADANKVKEANGEMANLSIDSFADMTEAIHIIQSEMGITGTTAKEASSTISGSLNATKASWQNLITGIADENQNFDSLVNNFADSVTTAAENLLPRIATALGGIVKLVEGLLPQIPPLIQQFLPIIIDGIMSVTEGIVAVLPDVVNMIIEVIPQLITALLDMTPTLFDTCLQIIIQVVNMISGMLPDIVASIMEILPQLVNALIESIPQLLQAAITFLMAIVQALPTIIDALILALPQIVSTTVSVLLQNLPILINGAIQLFMGILAAIPHIIIALASEIPSIITGIVSGLIKGIPEMINVGKDLLKGLFKGFLDPKEVWNGIKKLFNDIVNGLKDLFKIHSPSKVMADIIGKNLALGIGEGFEDNIKGVNAEIQNSMNFNADGYSGSGVAVGGRTVNIYQTNNYAQTHSRYELYKSKQQTAAAVRLAMGEA